MRATQSKKQKNILHNVKLGQWQDAERRFVEIRMTRSSISWKNLLPAQEDLWAEYIRQPKNLVGQPVLKITNDGGALFQEYPYPATILKVSEKLGSLYFSLLLHPIDQEEWNEEKVEEVALFQILPLNVFARPDAQMQEYFQFNRILQKINTRRNDETAQLKRNIADYFKRMESHQREVRNYERLHKEASEKLDTAKDTSLKVTDIQAMLDRIASLPLVKECYITKEGNVYVYTEMLFAVSKKTNKKSKTQIGEFVFQFNSDEDQVRAYNLTYIVGSHGHPNLSGASICLGANESDVHAMVRQGEFYQLTDFLLLFFSLFPHDGGSPYLSHKTWLLNIRSGNFLKPSSPFSPGPRLYEGRKTTTTRVLKKKGKQTPSAKVPSKKAARNTLTEMLEPAEEFDVNELDEPITSLGQEIESPF